MPPLFPRVAVLGAGSFGTAVAHHLAGLPPDRCGQVLLYGRDPQVVAAINSRRENPAYLPGLELAQGLAATADLAEALEGADLAVLALPAQHLRGFLVSVEDYLKPGVPLLDLAKGIEQRSLKRMSQVIAEVLGPRRAGPRGHNPVAALSGPSFAADIVAGHPIGLTLGSRLRKLLARLQALLTTPDFDIKSTTDIAGVELGGALKNVFAVAAGVFAGCGLGNSLGGDFFTRAMVEMRDVGMYLGGRWATFSGRSGLGDLAVTCTPASRNYRFGVAYARLFAQRYGDEALDHEANAAEALAAAHADVFDRTIAKLGTRTVEGYDTLAAVHAIVTRKRMFTPIILSLHRLLHARAMRPDELLTEARRIDLARRKEGPRLYSILLHQLLPRVYYRRR